MIPSDEFKALVSSLRSALFADECGTHMLPPQRDALMLTAEANLMSWIAHRRNEIEALSWTIHGDHG